MNIKKFTSVALAGVLLFTAIAAVTQIDWVTQVKNSPVVDVRSYVWTPQTPGGTLSPGVTVITLRPVPKGVNATDSNHYLYISGGSGTAEAVLITGGTAVSGASSGSIIVTVANSHSGAWTIGSATAAFQEAIQSLLPSSGSILSTVSGGGTVTAVPATYNTYAPIYLFSGITIKGQGQGVKIVQNSSNSAVVSTALYNTTKWGLEDLSLIAGGTWSGFIGLDVNAANSGVVKNVSIFGSSASDSTGIKLRGSKNPDTTFDYHNFASQNSFYDIIITGQIGVVFAATGNGAGGTQAGSTQNTFYNTIMNLGTGPGVDFQSNTDTNFFYNTYVGYGGNSSQPGIVFNSGAPSSNNGVGGNFFYGLHITSTDPTSTVLKFNYTDPNFIVGYSSVGATTPYTMISTTQPQVILGYSSGDATKTMLHFPNASAIRSDDGSGNLFYFLRSQSGGIIVGDTGKQTQVQGSLNVVGNEVAQGINYASTETGVNNALIVANPDGGAVAITPGLTLTIKLAHTLQAGANTLNYASHGNDAIKKHTAPSTNLTTGYAVGSMVTLTWDGSVWQDMSQ